MLGGHLEEVDDEEEEGDAAGSGRVNEMRRKGGAKILGVGGQELPPLRAGGKGRAAPASPAGDPSEGSGLSAKVRSADPTLRVDPAAAHGRWVCCCRQCWRLPRTWASSRPM